MYKSTNQRWQFYIDFILLDMICLLFSLAISFNVFSKITLLPWNTFCARVMTAAFISSMVISMVFDPFQGMAKRNYRGIWLAAGKHSMLVFAGLICYLYLFYNVDINLERILITAFVIHFISSALSYAVRVYYLRHNENVKRSMILITTESALRDDGAKWKKEFSGQIFLSGVVVVDADLRGQIIHGLFVSGRREDVWTLACREWVDEVLIDLPLDDKRLPDLVGRLNRMGIVTHVRMADESFQSGKKQFVERMGSMVVYTTSMNCISPAALLIKRIVDIAGGLVGLVLTGMLCLVFAPVIKLQSLGPVFFSQIRIGRNGRRFKMYKFRTMYLDAEERKKELMKFNRVQDGHMFKLTFDPRIIGNRILPDGTRKTGMMDLCRRLSLDEFPQFWNVLKGDMSLVGTRPPTVDEFEAYEPHHRARLACRPGITGMWQISGRSNITDFEKVVQLDTQYINEWKLSLDFKILCKTIVVLLKREGAM